MQQYVQQYTWYAGSSWLVLEDLLPRYETGNKRGEFHFLTILGHLGERASRHPPPTHQPPTTHHPPPTHYPPPTIHPRTNPVLQYSNAAVRREIHLIGEQTHWLQCSRAGRDLKLFTIPRHTGGQASRPREGDFHAPPSPRWGTDARSFAGMS